MCVYMCVCVCVCVCVRVCGQPLLTLCGPMNYSPPGSSVHGILQARMVEWVAMFSSRESSRFIDWNCISYLALAGGFFTTSTTWERTNSSFLCFFVAFRPSVDCMMPPGENNLLLTLVIQRLISSRNTFTDTSRMFMQNTRLQSSWYIHSTISSVQFSPSVVSDT